MKRYSSTRRKIDKSGKRVYSTTYYPQIPVGNSDTFIFTKEGDRLDNLAYTHYGDNTLWWIIAKANEGFKGNIKLKIGIKIIVPMHVGEIVSELERLNSRVD